MTIRRVEFSEEWETPKGVIVEVIERWDKSGDYILMSVKDARVLARVALSGNYQAVVQELQCVLAGYAPEHEE